MSYNAFFFTMTPFERTQILNLNAKPNKLNEIREMIRKISEQGELADSSFWGKELAGFIKKDNDAIVLRLYNKQNPIFTGLLKKTFGEAYFYDLKTVNRIAETLKEVDDWTIPITNFLHPKKRKNTPEIEMTAHDLQLIEELVGVMKQITNVFIDAQAKGNLVINYWG